MRIVIIGLGTIGRTIVKTLAGEQHAVTLVDERREKLESLIEKYDVCGVVGNGACMEIQQEAGVREADLVIALTDSDEMNIFACMVARRVGARNTVARVRNPDYSRQIELMRAELGISMLVNPERDTANEIFNLINLPSIVQAEPFAQGRVLLVELVVRPDSVLAGQTLLALGRRLSARVLICAVQRGEKVYIPSGHFVLEAGDRIHVTSDAHTLGDFLSEVAPVRSPLKSIMIIGGGKTGLYLAEQLSHRRYRVKLIESDKETAEALSESLPRVTVVHGNGLRHDVLLEEGLEAMDALVSLTDTDEENMVVAMYASKLRVRRTVAQIKSDALQDMMAELGMPDSVSPKRVVADRIASYVRALANKRGSNVLTLSRLVGGRVEALEFAARGQERLYGKPLMELALKENCLIACLIRDDQVIIPDGHACIRQGDRVIVVTTHRSFDDLTDILA